MRRTAIALAASTMTLSLASCGVLNASGEASDASPTKGNDITVGLLLPERANSRYENFDYPIIKKKVESLTRKQGKVDYDNADASAAKQADQLQKMIDDGVDVILLDAVDSHAIADGVKKAKDAGIPVIAYDRLAEGPIDAYISFDNSLVGEVQGRTLVEALGNGEDVSKKIVMMNGSPTDPNAKQFKAGALDELTGKVDIEESFDTKDWDPKNAEANMEQAIAKIGVDNIAGVYSANDGMAAWHRRRPEGRGRHRHAADHRAGRRTGRRAADHQRRAVHERLQVVPAGGRGRGRDGSRQDPGQGHPVRRPHP